VPLIRVSWHAARHPTERRALAAEYASAVRISEEHVDPTEVAKMVVEAAASRNGLEGQPGALCTDKPPRARHSDICGRPGPPRTLNVDVSAAVDPKRFITWLRGSDAAVSLAPERPPDSASWHNAGAGFANGFAAVSCRLQPRQKSYTAAISGTLQQVRDGTALPAIADPCVVTFPDSKLTTSAGHNWGGVSISDVSSKAHLYPRCLASTVQVN
jgi:hypothetical protein